MSLNAPSARQITLTEEPFARFNASRIDQSAVDALRRGGAVLVLGHDRDGRQRCLLAADAAVITDAAVNDMARLARGIISCAIDSEDALRLGLTLLPDTGQVVRTAYLRSVESATGVTTGISAADRAHTLRSIGDPQSDAASLVTPGHVMPNYVPCDVCHYDALPEAILPTLRLAVGAIAAAWCDILDDSGGVANHDFARRLGGRHGIPLLSRCELG